MNKGLRGKVALVTGGSSGIGRAACQLFAREGASVVVADIDAGRGEETVSLIQQSDGQAVFVRTDVAIACDVENTVNQTVAAFGRLDFAFNNAGVALPARTSIVDLTEDEWERLININLKGVWLGMKYQIPRMLEQGGGAIVNTSSIFGVVATGGTAAYTASKHGVAGITKVAALEYARSGIRINAICPSHILTPMVEDIFRSNPPLEERYVAELPIGRLGTSEEVAEAVIWLCSDAASFVTGHIMAVDGGFLVP